MTEKTSNRIVHGFLVGLGFSIALVLVVIAGQYLYVKYMYREHVSEIMSNSEWKEYNPDAGLVISEHSPIRTDNNLEVIGVVKNNGEDVWSSISIEVELFDANGKFIDECSKYLSSPLSPSGSENFKVNCGGCEKRPITNFHHYDIRIKDASYKRPRSDS
jgi:hypothetical protein